MKLKAFRVQNYKKIRDTGWVDVDRLTVFVGKNEAGKTALFRGLSKLKPTDGSKYDPIKEFPHGRYTDEFSKSDWPVASARYALSTDESGELGSICGSLKGASEALITRHYSDNVVVTFEPDPQVHSASACDWVVLLTSSLRYVVDSVAPDGKGDAWNPIKATISKFFENVINEAKQSSFTLNPQVVDGVRKGVASNLNEQWAKDIVRTVVDDMDGFVEKLDEIVRFGTAKRWIVDNIPYFLYFGDYEVLNSAIYLPEFIQRLNQNDKSSRTRVQSALFKHVGADARELAKLGAHQPAQQGNENPTTRKQIDELDIKANAASIAMTRKFSDWWEQRRHKFTYKFHGDYFRIWVSDDLDPSDVELEERSAGLQYFFSFYLLFLVEAEDLHRDCILLLDEPGLHLHGMAQKKLISFLEKISEKNQTLYTTHSPFMIDGSHLERARAVHETPDGTLVSADVWPKDRDTLFPLQAALGYSVCQSLFLSRKQVIVEGPTDYMLFSVLNDRLRETGKGLDPNIILIPMGGTANLGPLASMLIGHDIQVAILLDSDPAGVSAMKAAKSLADIDSRCVMVGDFTGAPNARKWRI